MPEVLKNLQQKIVNFWKELDKSQKIRIGIISGILVAAIVIGLFLMSKTTYVPLFTAGIKNQSELGEMKALLDSGGYTNKVTSDNILVSSKSNDKAQAFLITKGYPKSVDTIFSDNYDKIGLSSTESDKKKLDKNTMERTLAAKLKLLDNIEDATVNLALPDSSIFLVDDNAVKTTASVMIKPRESLTKEQIHAVVMWVAKSVEKLDPKDITVVDYEMNELSNLDEDSLVGKASSQYEMKRLMASDIEKNVKKMFSTQFDSFDNMAVVVNPVLDFDTLVQTSKTLDNPKSIGGPAVITKDTKSIEMVNAEASGGAPGVNSNPAPSYQITANGQNSTYKEKSESVSNAYDTTESQSEKATGQMVGDKSSMAINLLYGGRVTDENKIKQEIEKVKQTASSLSGIPVANITVNPFKIAPAVAVQTKITDTIKQLIDTYGSFALIVFLAIALMIAARPKKKPIEGEESLELATASAAAAATSGPRFIVPDTGDEFVPEIALEERSEVKKQIDKFVKQKPDSVAQLFRNWLSDEWEG